MSQQFLSDAAVAKVALYFAPGVSAVFPRHLLGCDPGHQSIRGARHGPRITMADVW